MTAWAWPGTTIPRVVDGDTIDAVVTRDMGFGGSAFFRVRLRLNRINAPKASSLAGHDATARVVDLTTEQVLHVVTTAAYKYGGPDDASGEWMAEVTLPDGRNLSDLLVAEGHAVYWDGEGPRPADG